jgi:hypothetical protein
MEGVPPYGPEIPDSAIFEKSPDFKDFLLSKGRTYLLCLLILVLNGLLSSLRSPAIREKVWCKPKEAFLTNIVKKYGKKSDAAKLDEITAF